jgi:hypothetical protein
VATSKGFQYEVWFWEKRIRIEADGTTSTTYWAHHGNQWNQEGARPISQQAWSKAARDVTKDLRRRVTVVLAAGVELLEVEPPCE